MSTMAFGAGARVAMIGDSITHGGIHPSYIQQYYVDYFPERQVKIYNLGSGGDTAEGALARFDELISVDPTDAVVMFGVNDINFRSYVEHPDEEQLALLNRTVLHFVLKKIRSMIADLETAAAPCVLVDAPTLIESGFHRECDVVISVIASTNLRLSRIIQRDEERTQELLVRL